MFGVGRPGVKSTVERRLNQKELVNKKRAFAGWELPPTKTHAKAVFCDYRALTQTLSAESSSTPATSVVSFTYFKPDLLPGTALNSSR